MRSFILVTMAALTLCACKSPQQVRGDIQAVDEMEADIKCLSSGLKYRSAEYALCRLRLEEADQADDAFRRATAVQRHLQQ
jgi:hypothetical protein